MCFCTGCLLFGTRDGNAADEVGVSLNVSRPEPGEFLSTPYGFTFVIGQVSPPGSRVTCNGESCDVSEDGAFIGFVPIRRLNPPITENLQVRDARFDFVARHGDAAVTNLVSVCTPRSPSVAVPAMAVFDPLRVVRARREQLVGLEAERLGDLVYVRSGDMLEVEALGVSNAVCRASRLSDLTINLPAREVELVASDRNSRLGATVLSIQDQRSIRFEDSGTLPRWPDDRLIWGLYLDPFKCRFELRGDGQALDPERPLKELRICLDPGHHPDRGAVGPRGFEERESNLLLARETAKLLREEGSVVSLTREEEALPLRERHARIRSLKPDLLLSLHNNSVGDGRDPRSRHGTETYYLHPWSKPLAESVHAAILDAMGTPDLGCHRRNLYITRFPDCPAILIEPEYLILPEQEKKFMDPEYRRQLAGAVVAGIRKFMESVASMEKEEPTPVPQGRESNGRGSGKSL